jgi:hypothetical protein
MAPRDDHNFASDWPQEGPDELHGGGAGPEGHEHGGHEHHEHDGPSEHGHHEELGPEDEDLPIPEEADLEEASRNRGRPVPQERRTTNRRRQEPVYEEPVHEEIEDHEDHLAGGHEDEFYQNDPPRTSGLKRHLPLIAAGGFVAVVGASIVVPMMKSTPTSPRVVQTQPTVQPQTNFTQTQPQPQAPAARPARPDPQQAALARQLANIDASGQAPQQAIAPAAQKMQKGVEAAVDDEIASMTPGAGTSATGTMATGTMAANTMKADLDAATHRADETSRVVATLTEQLNSVTAVEQEDRRQIAALQKTVADPLCAPQPGHHSVRQYLRRCREEGGGRSLREGDAGNPPRHPGQPEPARLL